MPMTAYGALWREMAAPHQVRSFGIDRAADVHGVVRQHGLETALELSAAEGAGSHSLDWFPGATTRATQ
jgi:hypothetical protein